MKREWEKGGDRTPQVWFANDRRVLQEKKGGGEMSHFDFVSLLAAIVSIVS